MSSSPLKRRRSVDESPGSSVLSVKRVKPTDSVPESIELLSRAKNDLHQARSLLPLLSSSKHHTATSPKYKQCILRAVSSLRAVIASSNRQDINPEWVLTAQVWLVETLLSDAALDSFRVRKEIEEVLRKGLNLAAQHASREPYLRALQSAQIRFLLSEGPGTSSDKLARSEIKRICAEIMSDPFQPAFTVYHFLFLQHSIYRTSNSIDALLRATEARKDWQLHYIVLVMRLHFNLSNHKLNAAKEDLATLDNVFCLSVSEEPGVLVIAGDRAVAQSASQAITYHSDSKSSTTQSIDWDLFPIVKMYYLVLKTIYHAEWDSSAVSHSSTKANLKLLHELLDRSQPSNVEANDYQGIIRVPTHATKSKKAVQPLSSPIVSFTSPRTGSDPSDETDYFEVQSMPRALFYTFVYLLSCSVTRDPIGRNPKAKVFHEHGLVAIDNFSRMGYGQHQLLAGLNKWAEHEEYHIQIKMELLLSFAAFEIVRSKFEHAEALLEKAITCSAHDNPALWKSYQIRVTLIKAMLHHARDQVELALKCYTVVLKLEPKHILAQAGIVMIRMGREEERQTERLGSPVKDASRPFTFASMLLEDAMKDVITACAASPHARLQIVGSIIAAVSAPGIVKAKHHLSSALVNATSTENNHVKALILALLGNVFHHTRNQQAKSMFTTAWSVARGMGAGGSKTKDKTQPVAIDETVVGNARLGLWLGQKLLEIYEGEGTDQSKIEKQKLYNEQHVKVLKSM